MIEPPPAACHLRRDRLRGEELVAQVDRLVLVPVLGRHVVERWRSSRAALLTSTRIGPKALAASAIADRSAAMSRTSQCQKRTARAELGGERLRRRVGDVDERDARSLAPRTRARTRRRCRSRRRRRRRSAPRDRDSARRLRPWASLDSPPRASGALAGAPPTRVALLHIICITCMTWQSSRGSIPYWFSLSGRPTDVPTLLPRLGRGARRLGAADRRRHRALHLRGVDVLRPTPREARAKRRRPRSCVLSARSLFESHRGCASSRSTAATLALARNFGDHPHAIHGVGWQRPWRVAAHDASERAARARAHGRRRRRARVAVAVPRDAMVRARCRRARRDADARSSRSPIPARRVVSVRSRLPSVLSANGDDGARLRRRRRLGDRRDAAADRARRRSPRSGDAICSRAADASRIDNVFTAWDGEATLADPARPFDTGSPRDRAAGFLVVYAPPARDFLAVEPVTHMTDAFNRAARGERGTGTRILAAGAAFSCTMRIFARLRS